MDANTLLRTQLAGRLICESKQIAIGPTGPTGTSSPYLPIPGAMKAYTLYLDFDANVSPPTISRVYVPPGFFTAAASPGLAAGGTFTTNKGSDLVFIGGNSISMNNTTYAFCASIALSGYTLTSGGQWNPSPAGAIGNTKVYYSQTGDNSITLHGLTLANINGANALTPAPSGTAAGFYATVTIFYV